MSADTDARYLFKRAREEAAKANDAVARHACAAEIAAHRELALRYKVRALAISAPEQVLHDAMEQYQAPGEASSRKSTH